MNKKMLGLGLAVALGVGSIATAFAQMKPEIVVEQRQAAMTLQAKYFYAMLPMAQGKIPYDAAVISRNSGYLDVLTRMAWDGFTPATQGVKSRALPEVFSDPAKFKTAEDNLHDSVGKLVTASKGSDEGAVKAALNDVNKSCNGCHENFRAKAQ